MSLRTTSQHHAQAVIKLHRRQFVIGPSPYRAGEDWQSLSLGDGCVLSYCPELCIARAGDATGADWAILGLAIESRADCPDPATAIASVASGEVPGLTASWCGRWVLVGVGRLYLDACGLLGCLYGKDGPSSSFARSRGTVPAPPESPSAARDQR